MLITDGSVPPSNSPSLAHPYRAPPLKGMAGVYGSIPITATVQMTYMVVLEFPYTTPPGWGTRSALV
jgi:hypothetical protein